MKVFPKNLGDEPDVTHRMNGSARPPGTPVTKTISIPLQNQSPQAETIMDAFTLAQLVALTVKDKGCGGKDSVTKQLGADVFTDVVVKP